MEKLFKIKERGSSVKTEILAGITTFLAMSYILAVNPSYLGGIQGATPAGIFMATAISAAIATLCMAFFANYPVALASGMGLNAFFVYTICGIMETLSGFSRGLGYSIAPMAITVTAICVLRVVWIYTVFPLEGMNTITGLYISYPVTWTAATFALAVLAAIAFRKLFALEREIAGRDAAKKNENKESM
jgi:xanthine/uracil/vitamin C permease (AzgA family)